MTNHLKTMRERDNGLQPERTSLSWYRTLAGMGTLLLLTIRHRYFFHEVFFLIMLIIALTFFSLFFVKCAWLRNFNIAYVSYSKTVICNALVVMSVLLLSLISLLTHVIK
ncbi:DUF202 domain-containing protein [Escherichia coli]|nr:DUF202 domain-containing protein [Escherichia coli]